MRATLPLLLVLSSLIPTPARAQSPTDGVWLAVAHNSPFATRAGMRHRDFYEVGLRRGWTLGSFPGVTLGYAADVLPLVATTNNVNHFELRECFPGPSPGPCTELVLRTGTVFGAGINPVGLTADVGPLGSLSIHLHASVGAVWFARAVPDPEAERLNFTAAVGGAVRVPLRAGYSVLVGYTRHHASNGGMGRVNPGVDSHMLSLAMTRRRGHGDGQLASEPRSQR